MEPPHDPYHVRPFPQQPKRGGKALKTALSDLESALSESIPNIEALRSIQDKIHAAVNTYNDDRLVDMVRQISNRLDKYQRAPSKELMREMLEGILKIYIELKHF